MLSERKTGEADRMDAKAGMTKSCGGVVGDGGDGEICGRMASGSPCQRMRLVEKHVSSCRLAKVVLCGGL